MELPEEKMFEKKVYSGPEDENGLPHGYGNMEYHTSEGPRYMYTGLFVHGKRHGFGTLCELTTEPNPVEPWEWYQEGDYDNAGRLVHPAHESGSYKEYIDVWLQSYSGWWVDDNPKYEYTPDLDIPEDFEITHDKNYLKRFINKLDVRVLPDSMVNTLRESDDPYGKYGYAQWLYRTHLDKESLKTATELFKYAADNGVADALYMLSRMYLYGEAYDTEKDTLVFDRNLSQELYDTAIEKGSEFARLVRNSDLFYGRNMPADRAAAIAEAEMEAKAPGALLMWREQLGWYYEAEERLDDAIAAYEECIHNGYYAPIDSLAYLYYKLGNVEYYEALMEEGIFRRVAPCYILGYEHEAKWDELDDEKKNEIHERLNKNLEWGVMYGDDLCAYALANYLAYSTMGFPLDVPRAIEIAKKGVVLRDRYCCELLVEFMENPQFNDFIPEDMRISKEEKLQLMLMGARYGSEAMVDKVIENSELLAAMGYGDEIENIWRPKWELMHESDNDDVSDEETGGQQEEKTEIVPTVLVIQPSGFVDFVEADVNAMSSAQMAELIGADGLDAVHFSNPLTRITNACRLDKQVTMYVDRRGMAKDLDDNAVATMLYGNAYEIRGAVIIAMEDNKYDVHSFDTEEDVENVFEEIYNFTGGLVRRDLGQEDGRYDPWA